MAGYASTDHFVGDAFTESVAAMLGKAENKEEVLNRFRQLKQQTQEQEQMTRSKAMR